MKPNKSSAHTTRKWLSGIVVGVSVGLIGYLVHSKPAGDRCLTNSPAGIKRNSDGNQTQAATRKPSAHARIDTANGVTTYSNNNLGFEVQCPESWKIDHETIDKASLDNLEESSVVLTIYQGAANKMTKKLEFWFDSGRDDLANYSSKTYHELGDFTSNGCHWSYGKVYSDMGGDFDTFLAHSVIDRNSLDANGKKITIRAYGYVFNGPESSQYTDEDAATFREILATLQFACALPSVTQADDFPPRGFKEMGSEESPAANFKIVHFKRDPGDFASESQLWLQALKPEFKTQLLFTHSNRATWLISPDEGFIALNHHLGSGVGLLHIFVRDQDGLFHEQKKDFFDVTKKLMSTQLKKEIDLDHMYCMADSWLRDGRLLGHIDGHKSGAYHISGWYFIYDVKKDRFLWDLSEINQGAFNWRLTP